MMFSISGCTKPEDKIRGKWEISKIYKNNIETRLESPSQVESLFSSWTFYRSTILIITYSYNAVLYETSGSWSLIQNNDFLEVSFTDKYSTIERRYTIKKFKANELKVSFVDQENIEWTFVFALQYSFQDYDI